MRGHLIIYLTLSLIHIFHINTMIICVKIDLSDYQWGIITGSENNQSMTSSSTPLNMSIPSSKRSSTNLGFFMCMDKLILDFAYKFYCFNWNVVFINNRVSEFVFSYVSIVFLLLICSRFRTGHPWTDVQQVIQELIQIRKEDKELYKNFLYIKQFSLF